MVDVKADFSANELIAFMQAQGAEGDGLSSEELVAATGRSAGWVRDRLKELATAGHIVVRRKRAMRIDGTPCLVPAYSLRKEGEPCN